VGIVYISNFEARTVTGKTAGATDFQMVSVMNGMIG
jgi:hypothetical protein